MENIIEIQGWFFEKIHKIDNLAKLKKKRRRKKKESKREDTNHH